ncbi:MAG: extracellular solute-binding protein [Clostridiales bacterium]|nr:extracellular solute-binding protein [Clostridiales bacterium]
MKKQAKLMVIGLSLILALSTLTGCGQTAAQTGNASTQAPAATQQEATNQSATTEGTQAQAGTPAVQPGNPTLPLTASTETFKIWWWFSPPDRSIDGLKDSEFFKELEKRTGVHIEFIHPSGEMSAAAESYNLMIASGDYTDMIFHSNAAAMGASSAYTGGYDKAIDDKVYLRLNELIDQYAPNYKSYRESSDYIKKNTMTDSGNIWAIQQIYDNPMGAMMGPVVRKDWLDSLGMQEPVTVDDWTTMLQAFKDKKGATDPFLLISSGFSAGNTINSAYGITDGFINRDGKAVYSPIEPAYKDYLALMNSWYTKGLVNKDFITVRMPFPPDQAKITTGKAGAWDDGWSFLEFDKKRANDPNYHAVGVTMPVLKAGDKNHLGMEPFQVGNEKAMAITTACKNPELAIKWMDYFYSPDGVILSNYGTEGKTYTLVDGKPVLSDFIGKNEEGLTMVGAENKYLLREGPMLSIWERELPFQSEEEVTAFTKTWTQADNAYVMPTLSLTSAEGSEYANAFTEFDTYAKEMTVKFIVGKEPLTKWDEYVAKIKELGVDKAVAIQQAALDRYNARK